ncbi:MAG TPA: hypothetical protein VNI02_12115 [Blastocatellia bacterium]|jgi:predicted transcriptional regulator|nr:hypothetical protein [Blastocatellia bacterium]
MGRSLTLEIPEHVFESLQEIAKQTGRTPEEIILESVVTHAGLAADDSLEKWIGAFDSGLPDLGSRHHDYVGQSLLDEMRRADEGVEE